MIFQLTTPQQLLQGENALLDLMQKAAGQLFSEAFATLLENPDLQRTAIEALYARGKKWKSKGHRKVKIRSACGVTIQVKTPYYVPDHQGKRGRKRRKRGKKGCDYCPVLQALDIYDADHPCCHREGRTDGDHLFESR